MSHPFFSIITPSYNPGDRIFRAARSLSENLISYEHIVIDDCSTDGAVDKLPSLGFDSLVVRNDYNVGPGPSRNEALKHARGKYIIFLDADDYFIPGALDTIHKSLISSEYPDAFVFGHYLVRSNFPNFLDTTLRSTDISVSLCRQPSLLQKYFLDSIVSAPWGKCIAATIAKEVKFPDLPVSQDAFYNLDVFAKSNSAIVTDCKLYVFDKSDDQSLTSKPFDFREFRKFYRSWILFEKKVLNDPFYNGYRNLLYARKIKFCVLYYLNRMALTPLEKIDPKVVGLVKTIFIKNYWPARRNLSSKAVIASTVFCLFPTLTLRILRLRLLRMEKLRN